MFVLPKNFPALLRAAGLTVVEIDGWETRGRPATSGSFAPVGSLNHHTGSHDPIGDFADDLAYAKWLFLVGRPDLAPPLCQWSLSTEGTVYVGAAGRANHAGEARRSGSVAAGDGNSLYVGGEWMLSGTQEIPDKMYKAGATVNAVILGLLGSSVQAVSCHYQTSVTGKWDIGDPDGIVYNGHRVLDVTEFRRAVKAEVRRLRNKPQPKREVLTLLHASMYSGASTADMRFDIDRIFGRGADIITGTEASGERARPMPALLRAQARTDGYWIAFGGDCWIAVGKDLAPKAFEDEKYRPIVKANEGGFKHTAKGLVTVLFDNPRIGEINVGASHYLTRGREKGDPNYRINRKMAGEIGEWASEAGKGKAICFYGGDQNISDRKSDTFFGSPLTSAWDEMERWENTGHGNIDVIASYDGDARVDCLGVRALDDSEFRLRGNDHYLVEARYAVDLT